MLLVQIARGKTELLADAMSGKSGFLILGDKYRKHMGQKLKNALTQEEREINRANGTRHKRA